MQGESSQSTLRDFQDGGDRFTRRSLWAGEFMGRCGVPHIVTPRGSAGGQLGVFSAASRTTERRTQECRCLTYDHVLGLELCRTVIKTPVGRRFFCWPCVREARRPIGGWSRATRVQIFPEFVRPGGGITQGDNKLFGCIYHLVTLAGRRLFGTRSLVR